MTGPPPPLVEARGLRKTFREAGWLRARHPAVRAVDGVDLVVHERETVGLVGESGSGKSTLARLLVRLTEPDAGSLRFEGADLLALGPRELRRLRRRFQIVFQDASGALNPRARVGAIVAAPLAIHRLAPRAARPAEVRRLLDRVGLDPALAERYPHELSGGQRQRVGIARAIACAPRFVVADEPVSALDPPIQAQIVNLLAELQESLGLAWLLIAHDLRLVRHVCDRVLVMYLGRIVEEAPARELFARPLHPYTAALLAATPEGRPGGPALRQAAGEPPGAAPAPGGCAFHPRCPHALPACAQVAPRLVAVGAARKVACHLVHPPGSGETAVPGGA